MSANFIDAAAEKAVIRKLSWRLAPLLTLGFVIAQIDRANTGMAALQMNHDLGLSSAEFGIGAGLFFVSYVIFEIPSTMIQARVGGPRWLSRIMISWGIASAMMAFVSGPYSFYGVRLLIGAMEAGYFPGVMLYLAAFFPPRIARPVWRRLQSQFLYPASSARRFLPCSSRSKEFSAFTAGNGCF